MNLRTPAGRWLGRTASVSNRSKGAGQLVMMQFAFIGVGAGAAAALLFASVTSGVWLSIPLFYLAPLPIMIAGLGWSHWSAMIAAATGALALGLAFGPIFFFSFLAGAGLPAWLALLSGDAGAAGRQRGGGARMVSARPPGGVGRHSRRAGGGGRHPQFRPRCRELPRRPAATLSHVLHAETDLPANAPLAVPGISNADRLIDFLVTAIPPAAAVLATITNVLNLWLAATRGEILRPAEAAVA